MKKRYQSFSRRLSARVLSIAAIIFLIALSVEGLFSDMLLSEESKKNMSSLLNSTISEIEAKMSAVEHVVESSSWLVEESLEDNEYLYHITRQIVTENDVIVGSTIAFSDGFFEGRHFFSPYSYNDEYGNVLSKQLGTESYDYFTMDWFAIPFATGLPAWSEPYFDEGGGDMLMSTYSYPIKDADGFVIAVITADVKLEWLNGIVEQIHPYANSYLSLFSERCFCISSGNPALFGINSHPRDEVLTELYGQGGIDAFNEMLSGKEGLKTVGVKRSRLGFIVFKPLANGWLGALYCGYFDVLSQASRLHLGIFVICILGLLVLFLFCYFIIRRQTKHLEAISDSARLIATGNFHTELPEIDTNDEIRQLRDSMDFMQSSLNVYVADMERTAVERERFQSELAIAGAIQKAMLKTDFPAGDNVDLFAMLRPAKGVGGDMYDFLISGRNLYIAIADVSGKGIPASLTMAFTLSSFRFVSGLGLTVAQCISRINKFLSERNIYGMFATLFAAKINLDTLEMTFCNAGHNHIVLNGEYLDERSNIALGLIDGFEFEQQQVQLHKGDRLILYTDGVVEAENAAKCLYSDDHLLEVLSSIDAGASAREVVERVSASVDEHLGGIDQNDDITIMTVKL